MINQYKRQDVFLCTHDAHQKHGHRVSVYHVMRRKQCYPDGCTYFRWRCKELERRKKCFRGYTHVGRKCFGCKFFDEEKMTRNLIGSAHVNLISALEEVYNFEEWMRDAIPKEHECLATISSVKPRLVRSVYRTASAHRPDQEHNRLMGYLVCFGDIYIGDVHLEDYSYAVIGRDFQKRLRLIPGDRMEFRASFQILDGRIVFQQLKHIQFKTKSDSSNSWTDSDSLIVKYTGQVLLNQADKCIACDQGMLIDVIEHEQGEETTYHRMYCMKGMRSASLCTYNRLKEIYGNVCHNRFIRNNGKK
jgi:hypothetical protein